MGRLIPAGTGLARYRKLKLEVQDEGLPPEDFEEELHEDESEPQWAMDVTYVADADVEMDVDTTVDADDDF